ncbi:hypothetical protein [Bradyrhizobium arachidis]|uniref:hypothetical protein n=1 Tax=Bradyrhizobium arachidis TaxID=858423 RepID=UPI002163A333|nr:hypothetical protein [Bradyrhizobium arachidis]UVO28141.1 hypothetical protein KUF59_37665 [Bradyrhizobium arachidis]
MQLLLTVLTALFIQVMAAGSAAAQFCPSANQCRQTPPAGKLRFDPNSAGQRVWTTPCGPNTNGHAPDQICREIASCANAGGFGKFLKAVSGQCQEKHFDGYFGLDGMTFGILDWTSSNLPGLLKAYQQRGPASFAAQFDKLNLPTKDGCLDREWTCRANQQAELMCKPDFRSAFAAALKTVEFRKAQMDYALAEYELRLARYASLGLKTEFGNTAMAVVANNLRRTQSCQPVVWKEACKAKADEWDMVNCMLDQYVKGTCRGSLRGSLSRVASIRAVFPKDERGGTVHPTASAVEQCVADWSR